MELQSLKDLYVDQLRDLYSAEGQMLKVMPRMANAATNAELKERFRTHQRETERHVERLARIFADLGEKPTGLKCKGMEGLIAEGEELMKKAVDPDVLDAALVATQQRLEHYEIAGYGCVRTYASMLDLKDHQRILQETLDEEGQTDHRLTDIAVEAVNEEARQ